MALTMLSVKTAQTCILVCKPSRWNQG